MLPMNRHASAHAGRGLDVHDRSGGGGGLPAGWQQRAEIVLVGHGRDPLQHVGQIGLGVVAVAAGAFHQGVDDGGALTGGLTAHELSAYQILTVLNLGQL